MSRATSKQVHLVEAGGFLYAALPGEKKAFRKGMQGIGLPIELTENPGGMPAYCISAEERAAFEDLIAKHYPDWTYLQWHWRTWKDIPPWARECITIQTGQALESINRTMEDIGQSVVDLMASIEERLRKEGGKA